MLNTIQRTGSIAQDALRLGFQTTCNKGIATLLKVNDITVEECGKFEKKHSEKIKKDLKTLEYVHAEKLAYEFKDRLYINHHAPNNWFFRRLYYRKIAKQVDRQYNVKILSVDNAQLNLDEGMWTTTVNIEVKSSAWVGTKEGADVSLEAESYRDTIDINTRAMKCVVRYTNYDDYHCRYIPDDAAEAAREALDIGMDGLKVAFPKVIKSVEPQPDPIIIGHVKEQMFIIAWFGYDKNNHMSCNI